MKFPLILRNSPNFDQRPKGAKIDKVILHYTGMPTRQEAIDKLCDDGKTAKLYGRVSSHYVIAEDGTVYALVDEEDRAWHAGVSYWRGQSSLNDSSIGIELVNPGHDHGYRDFPHEQMESLVALMQAIMRRHPIKQEFILAHSDVAPSRKMDPGEKFNWKYLAKQGVGVWPKPADEDYAKARVYLSSPSVLRGALTRFGYNPEVGLPVVCRALNHHFGGLDSPDLSMEVAARLACLSRQSL